MPRARQPVLRVQDRESGVHDHVGIDAVSIHVDQASRRVVVSRPTPSERTRHPRSLVDEALYVAAGRRILAQLQRHRRAGHAFDLERFVQPLATWECR